MTISFTSGQSVGTEVTVEVPISNDDILEEKMKTFIGSLVLQPTPLNVTVEPHQTEVVIVDDDSEGRSALFLCPSLFTLSLPSTLLSSHCHPSFHSFILFFPASVLFAAYVSAVERKSGFEALSMSLYILSSLY